MRNASQRERNAVHCRTKRWARDGALECCARLRRLPTTDHRDRLGSSRAAEMSGDMSPNRLAKPCAAPACPMLVVGRTYCATHQRAYDHRPRATNPRGGGNNPEWRALRERVIARDPTCSICRKAKSTVADHITPKRDGGLDTLVNLQGVCLPCNSRKAATSEGGFGNRRR